MLIAKITQNNLELTMQEINIPYQHSQGLEIEFIRDDKYKDYTLLPFYKLEGDIEAKLMKCNNDIISIAKDVFKKIGKVSFSFSLTRGEEVIHLGIVEFCIHRAFGDDNAILPEENNDTWMELIENIAKDKVDSYWDAFYKEQIDSIVRDLGDKVNDASKFANQADLAKTEAQQSATSASNSASNALESSNKAKEHLDSINTAVNSFNTDYASKVGDFNTNVEDANIALDTKIEKANTDLDKKMADANTSLDTKISEANNTIDTKVTEATEQASKAKQEADRAVLAMDAKLDKNQGAENAGKTMVVDADGNIVPGSALPDNVYTQEEVDSLLQDKMDIPYSDITITQDVNVPFTTNSTFKILDSIAGEATVKTVGKNLFNFDYASNLNNWTLNVNGWDILPIRVPKGYILVTSGDKAGPMNRYYAYFSKKADGSADVSLNNYLYNNSAGAIYGTFTGPVDNIVYLNVTKNKTSVFLKSFKNLQLEVGRVATDYQPYIESLELESFNPTTNVLVDGEVTIHASYPKDILAVVKALEDKLLNLQTEVVKNV
ncbi:hypothetical protein [Thomasclavelia cocleata]|uniref:hypothetical protein n=1 Tax=Thomasclavelia cocleata TaxID=69824 RepID=UPI00242A488A|nr:hypothetical protein [Thomasclavelia cocleata]